MSDCNEVVDAGVTVCPCRTNKDEMYIHPMTEMWCEKCIVKDELNNPSTDLLTYMLLNYHLCSPSLARTLIENGANPNVLDDRNCTLLHKACLYDEIEFVQLFVEKCSNINDKNNSGYTALYLLCTGRGWPQEQRRKCIQILIESGKLSKENVDFVKSKIKSKKRKAILDQWEEFAIFDTKYPGID